MENKVYQHKETKTRDIRPWRFGSDTICFKCMIQIPRYLTPCRYDVKGCTDEICKFIHIRELLTILDTETDTAKCTTKLQAKYGNIWNLELFEETIRMLVLVYSAPENIGNHKDLIERLLTIKAHITEEYETGETRDSLFAEYTKSCESFRSEGKRHYTCYVCKFVPDK